MIDDAKLIADFMAAQDNLAAWKDRESELRKLIIERFASTEADKTGVENVVCGNKTVKITHKLSYKLTQGEALHAALAAVRKNMGDEIAARLVKYDPELSVSEFKKLPPLGQAAFNGCLTIKPAAKSVEILI